MRNPLLRQLDRIKQFQNIKKRRQRRQADIKSLMRECEMIRELLNDGHRPCVITETIAQYGLAEGKKVLDRQSAVNRH